MRLADFDFELPEDRIALRPASPRDAARLLGGRRGRRAATTAASATCRACCAPGDALVFNDTRVIAARLTGRARRATARRSRSRRRCTKRLSPSRWTRLRQARPAAGGRRPDRVRRARPTAPACSPRSTPTVAGQGRGRRGDARLRPGRARPRPRHRRARRDAAAALHRRPPGRGRRRTSPTTRPSTPARTARWPRRPPGLHFTPELLEALSGARRRAALRHPARRRRHLPAGEDRGRRRAPHARRVRRGLGGDRRGAERRARARAGASSRSAPRRCGCWRARRTRTGAIRPFAGETSIFITPGYRFRTADGLITNFHLPRSTLFMLVSAFCGPGDDARGLRPRHRDAATASIPTATPRLLWRAADERRFAFRIEARDGAARDRRASRPRAATIRTPAFMPLGTAGDGQGADRRPGAQRRRRHHPRQHLPPDAAARRPSGWRGWAACTGSCAGTGRSSPTPAASR